MLLYRRYRGACCLCDMTILLFSPSLPYWNLRHPPNFILRKIRFFFACNNIRVVSTCCVTRLGFLTVLDHRVPRCNGESISPTRNDFQENRRMRRGSGTIISQRNNFTYSTLFHYFECKGVRTTRLSGFVLKFY